MSYIRTVKTASGATAVQIASKRYGRIVRIEHIGSAHNEADLQLLLTLAKKRLIAGQISLFPENLSPPSDSRIILRRSWSGLLFRMLDNQYRQLGFDTLRDRHFKYLCIARLVEPVSKLDSIRVLAELGIDGISKDMLYRCLKRVIKKDYRGIISAKCYVHAAVMGISLVLYDVTTLYFEIQKEDEYRKPGLSKERRLEPQIIIGLLVDASGFPLGLHSFEGNTAETTTIIPVLAKFKKQHNINVPITVVADAAMLSVKNLDALTQAGYHYIVGSRMNKIPYDIAEYQKTDQQLADGQIITTQQNDHRVIYQYREKRAKLDLHNIEKQVRKATAIVEGKAVAKKTKFLNFKSKTVTLNQTLIDKAKTLAGIKGYVTNLSDESDSQIITYYHQLFRVEASFRMCKSDLRARPIFHHLRDSIEAHLTIVLAALAIGREVEHKTGLSIKQVVKDLKPIRTGVILAGNTEYQAEEEISPNIERLLGLLN